MSALAQAVSSGRALYVGLSSYPPAATGEAVRLLRTMGAPCLVHQPRYSMFDRWVEPELLPALEQEQLGAVVFSPLAKGLLTSRYFDGIPTDSRASRDPRFLRASDITPEVVTKAKQLNEVATSRGQTLAQMALAWVLRHPIVTSAIIGASRIDQLEECVATIRHLAFAAEELAQIDRILAA